MIRNIATCLIAGAALTLAGSLPAMAQGPPCAPRTNIVDVLGNRYEESLRAIGLVSEKAVLEIFVSQSGTWTALMTNPAGLSCVVAAGQAWQEIPLTVEHPSAGS